MNTLFNFFANRYINKFKAKTIEPVLEKSLQILDKQTLEEIKAKTSSFISNEGGYCDRAGKADLYYTLFGYLVSEAIDPEKNNEKLKNYIQKVNQNKNHEGVYLYCSAILQSKLFALSFRNKKASKQIKNSLLKNILNPDYSLFLGILTLFYQKEYLAIYRIFRKTKNISGIYDFPCPVLAAITIIQKAAGKEVKKNEKKLMDFYCGNGSFSALKNSPTGDLLSTAVALFALKFIDADIRLIKPECLEYVDSLFDNGSFRATMLDFDTDIEYTFYGLLALGSLV